MLLPLLFTVLGVLSQVHATFSMQCIKCHSKESWDECTKHQKAVNCSTSNGCFTFHRMPTGPNIKAQHEYQKGCKQDRNPLECKEPNYRCSVEYCNTTMCNNGVMRSSNEIPTLPSNNIKNYHLKKKGKAEKKQLACYECSSAHSWDDCNKKQRLKKCPFPLNVCTTYHKILTLPSGNQEHKYEKGCWYDKECSNERCRETNVHVKGTWCDMRCCNSTQCNRGGIPSNTRSVEMQVMVSAHCAKVHQLWILTALVFLVEVVSGGYI